MLMLMDGPYSLGLGLGYCNELFAYDQILFSIKFSENFVLMVDEGARFSSRLSSQTKLFIVKNSKDSINSEWFFKIGCIK